MPMPDDGAQRGGAPAQPLFESLLAHGPDESAAAVVERYGLWSRPVRRSTGVRADAPPGGGESPGAGAAPGGEEARGAGAAPGEGEARGAGESRPHVALNMVSSVDGTATLSGRSAALSSEADRAHFHALRAASDAVMVGAGTARAERYGRIVRDPDTRRERRERGLSEEPLACIVSGTLSSLEDVPLLKEPRARVVILTASPASLPPHGAQVDYVRCERAGSIDLAAGLAELRARFGVQSLLCEGGPHLARELVAHALADELFLSLAPLLAGDGASAGESLRILAGGALDPPVRMELLDTLRSGSTLFLRYAVGSGARVA